jgi:hypothetical protein
MRYIMVEKKIVQFINDKGLTTTVELKPTEKTFGRFRYQWQSEPVMTPQGETIFHLPNHHGLVPVRILHSGEYEKDSSSQLLGYEIILNDDVPQDQILFVQKKNETLRLEASHITLKTIYEVVGKIINIGE